MFTYEDLVGAVLGTFFATTLVAGLLVLFAYCFYIKPKISRRTPNQNESQTNHVSASHSCSNHVIIGQVDLNESTDDCGQASVDRMTHCDGINHSTNNQHRLENGIIDQSHISDHTKISIIDLNSASIFNNGDISSKDGVNKSTHHRDASKNSLNVWENVDNTTPKLKVNFEMDKDYENVNNLLKPDTEQYRNLACSKATHPSEANVNGPNVFESGVESLQNVSGVGIENRTGTQLYIDPDSHTASLYDSIAHQIETSNSQNSNFNYAGNVDGALNCRPVEAEIDFHYEMESIVKEFAICEEWVEPHIDEASRGSEAKGGFAYYVNLDNINC